MTGFEAQNYTPDTLRDAQTDLSAQGQLEGFQTEHMIQRMKADSNLTADELSEISAEIQSDVSNVCTRSHELCEELKDQIFISRLKNGINLGVNGNGMIIDEGLFQKHFNINIAAIIEENNGGWMSRKTGNNDLEIGDTFTALLEGDDITFFNGENEAEFKCNVNTGEISRDDLGINDQSDDKSIGDIDMAVDKAIEDGLDPFSGGAREALLNPDIRKDFSQLSDQDIITLSEEIGLEPHFLANLQKGNHIVAHSFMSNEILMKIAGLLSIENPEEFINQYEQIKTTNIAPSVLITHDANQVSFTDNKFIAYETFSRI